MPKPECCICFTTEVVHLCGYGNYACQKHCPEMNPPKAADDQAGEHR